MRNFAALVALACAVTAGCGAGQATGVDPLCSSQPTWTTVAGDLDRSALSLWGSAEDDIYLVGGSLGARGGALAMHYDGTSWTEIPTGHQETLWWVWGAPDRKDVWMVGENGTILRWDGARIAEVASGTSAQLYGVWGSSSNDVTVVGGVPGEGGPDDVILHWDGAALSAVDLPARKGAAMFKVWGASKDDLWVSGEAGTLWHRTASGWVDESLPGVYDTLSTVHGCSASEVYTVGGQRVYRFDGARWASVPEAQVLSVAAGVSCGPGSVLVVGSGGLKLRLDRTSGKWIDDTLEKPYDTDFHGAWVSPTGDLWAAGGNYIAPASQIPRRIGVLAHRGCE